MNASKPPTPVPPTAVSEILAPLAFFLPLPPFPPPPPPAAGPEAPAPSPRAPPPARAPSHTSHCALAAWFRNVHEGQSQVFDDEAEDDSARPRAFPPKRSAAAASTDASPPSFLARARSPAAIALRSSSLSASSGIRLASSLTCSASRPIAVTLARYAAPLSRPSLNREETLAKTSNEAPRASRDARTPATSRSFRAAKSAASETSETVVSVSVSAPDFDFAATAFFFVSLFRIASFAFAFVSVPRSSAPEFQRPPTRRNAGSLSLSAGPGPAAGASLLASAARFIASLSAVDIGGARAEAEDPDETGSAPAEREPAPPGRLGKSPGAGGGGAPVLAAPPPLTAARPAARPASLAARCSAARAGSSGMGAGCLRVCAIWGSGRDPPTREDNDGKSSAPPTRAPDARAPPPRAPPRPAQPPATSFPPPPRELEPPPPARRSGNSSMDGGLGMDAPPSSSLDALRTASSCARSAGPAPSAARAAASRASRRRRSSSAAAPGCPLGSLGWFPRASARPASRPPPPPPLPPFVLNSTCTRSASFRSALVMARPCSRPSWFFSSCGL